MREIIFRGWNEELNNFIYGEPILLQEYNNRWVMLVDNELGEEWVYIKEPQQYTGLKDKNGREVYEGDILEYETGYKDSVIYCEGSFWAVGSKSCDHLYQSLKLSAKVVGNIYENPELLQ